MSDVAVPRSVRRPRDQAGPNLIGNLINTRNHLVEPSPHLGEALVEYSTQIGAVLTQRGGDPTESMKFGKHLFGIAISRFHAKAAHQLTDVTVVADAGVRSASTTSWRS